MYLNDLMMALEWVWLQRFTVWKNYYKNIKVLVE